MENENIKWNKEKKSFSSDFSGNIMGRISKISNPPNIVHLHKWLYAASIACIILMVGANFIEHGALNWDSLLGLSQIEQTDITISITEAF